VCRLTHLRSEDIHSVSPFGRLPSPGTVIPAGAFFGGSRSDGGRPVMLGPAHRPFFGSQKKNIGASKQDHAYNIAYLGI
jgi:hypothetical protein